MWLSSSELSIYSTSQQRVNGVDTTNNDRLQDHVIIKSVLASLPSESGLLNTAKTANALAGIHAGTK